MRKEKIKTIILVVLIINCFSLIFQIWFNKKLWSDDYNFFSYVTNNPISSFFSKYFTFGREYNVDTLYANAISAQKVVVSAGNAREVYYPDEKNYNELNEFSGELVETLIKDSNAKYEDITDSEWKNFLKSKSIFLDFGFNMSEESILYSFGKQTGASKSSSFYVSGIIITGDDVTNEAFLCMINDFEKTGRKYRISGKGTSVVKKIDSMTYGKSQNYSFAFELYLSENMDKKVTMSPLLLLPMTNYSKETVRATNPFNSFETIPEVSDRIVSEFGYVPSALRKSVSKSGETSYVENNATLTITPGGVIEYNAVKTDRSILLQKESGEPFEMVNGVIRIANNIWNFADIDEDLNLHLVSDLKPDENGVYTIKLNYYYNGLPVILSVDGKQTNAITAQVENGYLKKFSMVLRNFSKDEDKTESSDVITAIDSLFDMYSSGEGNIKIDDIHLAYYADKKEVSLRWCVRSENETIVIVGE